MFVKKVKIEKESTDVDIRIAIVSTKKGAESKTTLELIQKAHEDALYGQDLIYKILHQNHSDHKYDLNAVRLRFQVKLIEGIQDFLVPVISNPISMTMLFKEILIKQLVNIIISSRNWVFGNQRHF